MGSGEIAPTMAKVHRALFARFGRRRVAGVVVDTPYGFQENAADLSARTVEFFRDSVGRSVSLATYRSRDVGPLVEATAVARIREASYVMVGPGSPSYLVRQWLGGPIPDVLAERLAHGGIVTMASAAAVTLGVVAMPVYEIYKVGEEPHWLEGLDLLGRATGLRAAVVPHYDNAEGGNHDTRFCYVGERRLRVLEEQLPDDAFILGIDGHTALLLDLEAGTASVAGLGGATVRSRGRSAVFPSGSEIPIDALAEAARQVGAAPSGDAGSSAAGYPWVDGGPGDGSSVPRPAGLLEDDVARLEGGFVEGLASGDVATAVSALIDLGAAIEARLRGGEDSPDLDAATARFRSLIVRLGEAAVSGTGDPRARIEPFVAALLEVRDRARLAGDWPTADLIRDRLVAAGIAVSDSPAGSTWSVPSAGSDAG
jgi:hypothetical protein